MSFVIRPLFALAALAMATPAFAADIGTTPTTTTTAPTAAAPVTSPAPMAKTSTAVPSATVTTDTKTPVAKTDTAAKTDETVKTGDKMAKTPATPAAKVKSSSVEKTGVEKKQKVSEATHHHAKVTKKA